MEKIQKEGRWIPHELSEDNKNRQCDIALTLLSKFRKKAFCAKSLHAMKSGFFMITLNVENHGLTLINLRHRHQSPIFTPKKFCCVSGGIGKMSYITSGYNRVKQSRQNINQRNIPRLHQRSFAIFRIANSLTIEAHRLRSGEVINAFSYLFKSHEMCISQMMLQRPGYVVIGRRHVWALCRVQEKFPA